jgi:hypothetical protein
MKVLTKFSFAPLAKSTCYFLSYLSGITKREYNSQRADPVDVIEHRLLVAGFSPRRRLVLNIFRTDNNCVYRISSGLLIGSVAFLFQLLSPRTSSSRAKEPGPERYSNRRQFTSFKVMEGLHQPYCAALSQH